MTPESSHHPRTPEMKPSTRLLHRLLWQILILGLIVLVLTILAFAKGSFLFTD